MGRGNNLSWWGRGAMACLCVVAVAALLCCAGCGKSSEQVKEDLRAGISAEMDQLTSLTAQSATELLASSFTDDLTMAGVDPLTVYGPMFANLSYTIGDIQVDDDVARVALQVTNKDMTAVLQNYTAMMVNELSTQAGRDALAALDPNELTSRFANVLVQCLQDTAIPLVTTNVELSYVKDGSTWVLENGEALSVALLGGLDADSAGNADDALLEATSAAAAADMASLLPVVDEQAAAEAQPVEETASEVV